MKGLIFIYAMTYGGAVVSLFNPYVGLLIYVSFALLRPESLWHWSVSEGGFSRIIAIALLIGWAGNGFGNWNFGRAKPVVYALLGYMGWMMLSAALAPDPGVAWNFVEKQSKIVIPCVVGFTTIDSFDKLRRLAWVMMLSQGYVAYDLNMAFLGGFNELYTAGFGGMDNNCVAIGMVTGAGLAFFLGLAEKRWWLRWLAFAIAGLMVHAILFSFSRGGMLALLITGAATFILLPKTFKNLSLYALAVVLALSLAGKEVVARFNKTFADKESRDYSAQERLDLWNVCLDCVQKNPVVGLGPDHLPLEVIKYGFKAGKEAHSLWLQLAAELGVPGVGLLMAYYGLCVALLWPLARSKDPADPRLRDTARMVIASLVGFAVSAQFVTLEGLELPYYVALVGAGVLRLASQAEHAAASAPTPVPGQLA